MKKYWCVTTKFFDSGAVKAVMYDVKANEKPENEQVENMMCDEYRDYFESYNEARKFWEEAQKA